MFHLTEAEITKLLKAAKANRWGERDATMILMAYRHGFRACELVDLRWDQIDLATASLHVRRVKQGSPSTHPIKGDEMRAMRKLQREQEPKSPFLGTVEKTVKVHRSRMMQKLKVPNVADLVRMTQKLDLGRGHPTFPIQATSRTLGDDRVEYQKRKSGIDVN